MQIRCTQADHRNQQIIGFCIDSTCPNQRPYCHYCLPQHGQHLDKLTYFELFHEWIQKRIINAQNVQKNVQECKLSLDYLLNQLIPYLNFNIQQFQEIGISKIDNMIKGLCQLEGCEEILFKQLKQFIEQIKQIIDQILKNIKNQANQKVKCNQQFQKFDLKQSILEQPQNESTFKANSNQFTFELMKQNSIKVDNYCNAFAFNKDQSIVLAGYSKDIKVFENQQGKLNQVQLLSKHTYDVLTLNFMKKTNNFVSGSRDQSIIIWQVIGNNQWNCQQILNGHSYAIFCLLLNNTDDLIISGSVDKKIKFWMKQNQWICQQTISHHTDCIYSLSLNEQQNKLISCSLDSQILIIEQSKLDKQWIVTQKIKVDQYGCRLCFINDNLFTFQPFCKDQMYIYEMDTNNKQYNKIKEIELKCDSCDCDCLFPQQYIKSKCLLVNKNGNNLNLMRKQQNGDFIIQQSIEFGSHALYGQLSDDGEYLITWDKGSKEIQIRKCKDQ
ncbi:unnamed protein product [Paramecium pentaurelia]|uniref:WD40-repeat-containing domain n=1 Tax=Paramecium pentaurelia TaxID=43138 RepID=A0A8S1VND6_9CILI|nr:unnamed protein product [Paramecium pentaurelia]